MSKLDIWGIAAALCAFHTAAFVLTTVGCTKAFAAKGKLDWWRMIRRLCLCLGPLLSLAYVANATSTPGQAAPGQALKTALVFVGVMIGANLMLGTAIWAARKRTPGQS